MEVMQRAYRQEYALYHRDLCDQRQWLHTGEPHRLCLRVDKSCYGVMFSLGAITMPVIARRSDEAIPCEDRYREWDCFTAFAMTMSATSLTRNRTLTLHPESTLPADADRNRREQRTEDPAGAARRADRGLQGAQGLGRTGEVAIVRGDAIRRYDGPPCPPRKRSRKIVVIGRHWSTSADESGS
jgi:hypothetical protein